MFLAGGLFEGGLFDEAPMSEVPPVEHISESQPAPAAESDDEMDHFGGPPSVGAARYINSSVYPVTNYFILKISSFHLFL